MYRSYYSLSAKPFQINADPHFLWLGSNHKEALANLKYGFLENNGYVVLIGDVGTGKTTLVNALLQMLDKRVLVANINHPSLAIADFFSLIVRSYDPSAKVSGKADCLHFLKGFLRHAHAEGKIVLLVIDEAHRLSEALLEEIRLLSNMEENGEKLINIIFVGQTELRSKLQSDHCRAMRQRITLFYHLQPLSRADTLQYISHRLKVAGARVELFTPKAMQAVYRYSRGYPRLINKICDRALLTGYVKDQRRIHSATVRESAREISLIDPIASAASLLQRSLLFGKWLLATMRKAWAAAALLPEVARALLASLRRAWPSEKSASIMDRVRSGGGVFAKTVRAAGKEAAHAGRRAGEEFIRKYRSKMWFALPAAAALLMAIWTGLYYLDHQKPRSIQVAEQKADQTAAPAAQPPETPARHDGAEKQSAAASASAGSPLTAAPTVPSMPEPPAGNDSVRLTRSAAVQPASAIPAQPAPSLVPGAGPALPGQVASDAGEPAPGAAAPMPAVAAPPPAPSPFEMAEAMLAKDDYAAAIAFLETPNGQSPAGPDARRMLSRALIGRAGQLMDRSPEQAESLLRKAAESDSRNLDAYVQLGKIYTRAKRFPEAVSAYRKALEIEPQQADVLFNLGFVMANSGMFESAEEMLRRVVQLRPPYLDKALFNLAVVQQKIGKRKESLAALEEAVAIRPENQKALAYLNELKAAGKEN